MNVLMNHLGLKIAMWRLCHPCDCRLMCPPDECVLTVVGMLPQIPCCLGSCRMHFQQKIFLSIYMWSFKCKQNLVLASIKCCCSCRKLRTAHVTIPKPISCGLLNLGLFYLFWLSKLSDGFALSFSFTLVTDTFRLLVLLSNALIAFLVCGRSSGLGWSCPQTSVQLYWYEMYCAGGKQLAGLRVRMNCVIVWGFPIARLAKVMGWFLT